MVVLYGVVHGCHGIDFFGREGPALPWKPSRALLTDLAQFPSGTRVGVEMLTQDQWAQVHADAVRLADIHGVPMPVRYQPQKYWEILATHCAELGHTVTPLDSADAYDAYTEAVIISQDAQRLAHYAAEDFLEGSPGTTERDVLVAHWNSYAADLRCRHILEIERDEILLSRAPQHDVAIVGKGHADYWVAQQLFDISRYATEIAEAERVLPRPVFSHSTTADPEATWERESLVRRLRFQQTRRIISERRPTFVGTWNISEPWNGYFELFAEEHVDGKTIGTIEDFLGTAAFAGSFGSDSCAFTKKYTGSTADAVQSDIRYEASRVGHLFLGRFHVGVASMPFAMVRAAHIDPIKLFLAWRYHQS